MKDLTDASFKKVANGDYRPKSGGALFNAGDNGLYSSYAISATDLDGNPRVLNKAIDLGCWEVMSGASTRIILR